MVDGKVLYRDGDYTTIDVEKVVFEVEQAAERISKQL
jgi:5-methylthioadenosine/S-adenosylhomocysteine deaminase